MSFFFVQSIYCAVMKLNTILEVTYEMRSNNYTNTIYKKHCNFKERHEEHIHQTRLVQNNTWIKTIHATKRIPSASRSSVWTVGVFKV